MPKKLKEKIIEPYWNELIEVYFNFCRNKFQENPSFDGSAPRDMKAIIKSLHDRANKSNIEWTLEIARFRFNNFLEFSFKDSWLRQNFLLSNINRQKDKIFFNIRSAINKQSVDPFETINNG